MLFSWGGDNLVKIIRLLVRLVLRDSVNRSYEWLFYLIVMCFSVFAQSVTAQDYSENQLADDKVILRDQKNDRKSTVSPDLTPLPNESEISTDIESSPILSAWDFVRMVLVLGVIVAAIYLVFLYIKRRTSGGINENSLINILGSRSLGGSRNLHLIKVAESFYLVGAADEAVNLIAEITSKESKDALQLTTPNENTSNRRNFAKILNEVFSKKRWPMANKTEFLDSSIISDEIPGNSQASNSGSVFIRKQRDRLKQLRKSTINGNPNA